MSGTVISLDLKRLEKELTSEVKIIGINALAKTKFNLKLTVSEKKLLMRCINTAIDLLEGLLTDNPNYKDTYNGQIKLRGLLGDISKNNRPLPLTPYQYELPLISLEIGGKINRSSNYDINEIPTFWDDAEYKTLVRLFEKIMGEYRVFLKVMNPRNTPKYLK